MRAARAMLQPAVVGGAPFQLTPSPLPSRREAHIWYVRADEVNDNTILDRCMDLISPCEKRDVISMKGKGLQKCALLARALVRSTISRYTNCKVDPRTINFTKGDYGKPEVLRHPEDQRIPPSLHFNISHTSSLIACGIATVPIGIDAEDKSRKMVNKVLSVAQRYFSAAEVEYLASISDQDAQHMAFLKLWTLKESYVKATGRGFSGAPFKTFTIKLKESKFQLFPGEEGDSGTACDRHHENWEFSLVELQNTHFLATCIRDSPKVPGERRDPLNLMIQRTIPFVEDSLVSDTEYKPCA